MGRHTCIPANHSSMNCTQRRSWLHQKNLSYRQHRDNAKTTFYINDITERLHCVEQHHPYVDNRLQELYIVQCGGPQRTIINFNPKEALDPEHTL